MCRQVLIEVKPSRRHNVGGFALQPIPKGTRFTTNIPNGFRGFNYDANPNAVPINAIEVEPSRFRAETLALRGIRKGDEIVYPPYQGDAKKSFRQALDSHGFKDFELRQFG